MAEPNDLGAAVRAILSGKALGLLATITFTPLFVRLVSKSEYGVFATVMATFFIVEALARGGLAESITKHVAEYDPGSSGERAVVGTGVTLAIVYGTVTTAVLFVLALHPVVLEARYTTYLLLLGSVLVANNLLTVFRGAFYGRRREQVAEALRVAKQFGEAAIGLGLVLLGLDLLGVFLGYAASIVLVAVVGGWLTHRAFGLGLRPPLSLTDGPARSIVSFGGMQLVGGIAALLLLQTDVLLVNHFSTNAATASYRAAIRAAEFVWFVPSAIQGALLQNATSHRNSGDVDAINRNVRLALKYSALSLALFGVGLFVLADEFLRVYYGPAYVSGALSLRILIVGAVLFGLGRVFFPVLKSAGWIRYTELTTVAVLAVNVALNVLLIPRFGIEGAAVATAISYALMLVSSLALWRLTAFELPATRASGRLLATVAGFVLLYVPVARLAQAGALGSLLLNAALGGGIFVATCLLTGVVDRGELRALWPR